jgi:hypothetical protein
MRQIVKLSPVESNTLEALALRGLGYGRIAKVASRLFGRRLAKSTVQQHLYYRAKRQEKEMSHV